MNQWLKSLVGVLSVMVMGCQSPKENTAMNAFVDPVNQAIRNVYRTGTTEVVRLELPEADASVLLCPAGGPVRAADLAPAVVESIQKAARLSDRAQLILVQKGVVIFQEGLDSLATAVASHQRDPVVLLEVSKSNTSGRPIRVAVVERKAAEIRD